MAESTSILSHLLVQRTQLSHGEARRLDLLVRRGNVAHVEWRFVAAVLNDLELREQLDRLHLGLEVVDKHDLATDSLLNEVDDVLRDEVLLCNGIDDPVVEAIVDLARVDMDLLEDDECPGVDLRKTIREHILLIAQDDALLFVHHGEHGRILIDKLVDLRQEVAEDLLESRASAFLLIVRLNASFKLLLGEDFSVELDGTLMLQNDLINGRDFLDLDLNEARHVAHDLSHLLVRPATLRHVGDALE